MTKLPKNNVHIKKLSRANRPAFFVTRLGWLGGLLCLCGLAIFLNIYSYETITLKFAQWSGKTDRLDVLRNQYLTQSLFLSLRVLSLILVLIFALTYRWLHQVQVWLIHICSLGLQLVLIPTQSFKNLSKNQKTALLIAFCLVTASRIYYYWLLPLQYDETFTYIHLVNKGLLVSATYYPGPNNHVLFSEIAAVLNQLLPSLLALRLPSLVGGLLLWFLLWEWFNTQTRFEWALILASLILLTPTLSVYAVMGRGYSMQLLLALVGLRVVLATQYLSIHRFAFVLSSVLGFYLVPTYLYIFVTLVVFKISQVLLTKDRHSLKACLLDLVTVGLITSILYTPIILFNGLGAIIHNGWVQPLSFEQWIQLFPQYLVELSQALWGDEAGLGIGIGFLVVLLISFFLKPHKYFGLLSLALLFIIISVQRVLPPARTLQYLVLLYGWWIIQWLPKRTSQSKYSLVVTLALIAPLLFYGITTTYTLRQIAYTPNPHIEVAQKITSENKPQKVLVTHDTYAVFLQYFNTQSGNKHQIDIQQKKGVAYDWWIHSQKQLNTKQKLPTGTRLYLKNKEVMIHYDSKK
ncbi:hypothetical protein BKI52_38245 [marine bacterium AO1-C]|nr:hypothetical protein BKI52_38245 [marine bacterium AO1-C]